MSVLYLCSILRQSGKCLKTISQKSEDNRPPLSPPKKIKQISPASITPSSLFPLSSTIYSPLPHPPLLILPPHPSSSSSSSSPHPSSLYPLPYIPSSSLLPQTSHLRLHPSSLRPQTSSLRLQTSDFRLQTSHLIPQTSDLPPQTSDLLPLPSDLRPPTSDFRPPPSDFALRSPSHTQQQLHLQVQLLLFYDKSME